MFLISFCTFGLRRRRREVIDAVNQAKVGCVKPNSFGVLFSALLFDAVLSFERGLKKEGK